MLPYTESGLTFTDSNTFDHNLLLNISSSGVYDVGLPNQGIITNNLIILAQYGAWQL
jgi:hypothetical protein